MWVWLICEDIQYSVQYGKQCVFKLNCKLNYSSHAVLNTECCACADAGPVLAQRFISDGTPLTFSVNRSCFKKNGSFTANISDIFTKPTKLFSIISVSNKPNYTSSALLLLELPVTYLAMLFILQLTHSLLAVCISLRILVNNIAK